MTRTKTKLDTVDDALCNLYENVHMFAKDDRAEKALQGRLLRIIRSVRAVQENCTVEDIPRSVEK